MSNSLNVAAPLVLTILFAFFTGLSINTSGIFTIIFFMVIMGISLYWLIKRLEDSP